MVHQRKWYVVVVGTEPGVYSSWIEAGPKTRNIPGGAIFQSFPSEDEALRVFETAKKRGEVKAYPDAGRKDKPSGKSKNVPLSPLGEETALLRTPLNLTEDTKSTGLPVQTPLSSPALSRVAKLRRTLWDPTDSCSTSSSPPTDVTRVNAPLYEEDDIPRDAPVVPLSPHFTFSSSSSRVYPAVVDEYPLESSIEGRPLQLEVSDWDSPSPTLSSLNSYPGTEEHTLSPPRCMPLHPVPPSKSKGVEYRSFTDLAHTDSVDARIWLPKSRIFDPDRVKPRPLTRPSSPAKKDTSSVPFHNTVDDTVQLRCQISLADTSFVRAGRGRHSRLTPSLSLPTLPNRELEDNYSSHPVQQLENHRAGKAKAKTKKIDYSVHEKHLAERPTEYSPGPRNYGRSHVQLVPRDGKGEQSAIVVHCPPNCPHETCYRRPLVLSALTIEPSKPTSAQYVDACVSPIIAITSRVQDIDSPTKIRSERHLDSDHPCELAGFTHLSHKRIAAEIDVRSPIVKGTMIPMNAVAMEDTRK